MRPQQKPQGTQRIIQVVIGAGIGFSLGVIAALPFGVLGLIVPLIGLAIGGAVGWLSRRVALGFLAGFIVAGLVGFQIVAAIFRHQIGSMPEGESTSPGIWMFSGILADGVALLGGVLGAILLLATGNIGVQERRSVILQSVAVTLPVLFLGFAVLIGGSQSAGDWIRFEKNHAAERQRAVEEDKRRQPVETPYDMPFQSGPFLYPNRSTITGDRGHVVLTTMDTPETVTRYYVETLGARFVPEKDAASGAVGWTGDFLYNGKRLTIRIEPQSGKTGTNILVRAPSPPANR